MVINNNLLCLFSALFGYCPYHSYETTEKIYKDIERKTVGEPSNHEKEFHGLIIENK